jgi:hypothetical protein
MQGIYYLLSIAAVFVVFVWYIRNEGIPEGGPSSGLLAMKDSNAPAPETPKRRWQQRQKT